MLAQLVGAGVPVSGFSTTRTSLEEIFLRVYGTDSLHDAGVEPVGVGA